MDSSVQNTPIGVTVVITSCNRHKLLRETLKSFVQHNTYPITGTIIIEDSTAEMPDWMDDEDLLGGLGQVLWIANGRNKGQIYSIDRAYSEVQTDYIFHIEDDWKFIRKGFIEESLSILEKYPNILQVWLREDTAHPIVNSERFPFKIAHPDWNGWGGFSFNPGLRRLKDWQAIGSYGRHVGYDPRKVDELALSKLYQQKGFYAAKITTAVEHNGWNQHVDFEKTSQPLKVLVAIPACHKYDYKNHSDERIHKNSGVIVHFNSEDNKRIKAVKETWANYFPPFKTYVDLKFFYGRVPDNIERKAEEGEVFLDVADDYNSLPYKVKAIYQYALDNGYTHVFKGDDDTFIYLDRLMASNFEDHDYVGYAPDDPRVSEKDRYASGGSGYWLSRKAMEIVVKSPIELGQWAEDQWVGKVLYQNGIKVHRDARYLPGFWEHFVDVDSLPDNHSYITMHACTPIMMDKLYHKTLVPNFTLIKRAFHEDVTYGINNPRELEYNFEFQELLDLTLIKDMPDLNKDLKNKVNQSIELLTKKIVEMKKRLDILESRAEDFNRRSSQKF